MKGVKQGQLNKILKRWEKAEDLRKKGLSLEDTGKILGVSRQRVHQILNKSHIRLV